MLEATLVGYKDMVEAKRGALDAFREGMKEIKANYKGALYEQKERELREARDTVIGDAERACRACMDEAFASAREAVAKVAARPMSQDAESVLRAIDGLAASDAEKEAIMRSLSGNYLAARKAAQLLGIEPDRMPETLEGVLGKIDELEGIMVRNVGAHPDAYEVRAICYGTWIGGVDDAVSGFVSSYGEN